MAKDITPADRRRLAATAELNEQYLYQCLTGRRDMNPAEARRVEDILKGELMRWDLCQRTWFQIWPEMKDLPGAPEPGAAPSSEATPAG